MLCRLVVVTIDDHETVLTFESKEEAEAIAETERARLTEDENNAQGHLRVRPPHSGQQDVLASRPRA
jgi:hypothetical protein